MPRALTMSIVTDPFVLGQVTVTRRDWSPKYATSIQPGDVMHVFDRSRRQGGQQIAAIQVLSVTRENGLQAPTSDWYDSGFRWLHKHRTRLGYDVEVPYLEDLSLYGWTKYRAYSGVDDFLYVLRFALLGLTDVGNDRNAELVERLELPYEPGTIMVEVDSPIGRQLGFTSDAWERSSYLTLATGPSGNVLWLSMVAVLEDQRRRGHLTRLCEAAVERGWHLATIPTTDLMVRACRSFNMRQSIERLVVDDTKTEFVQVWRVTPRDFRRRHDYRHGLWLPYGEREASKDPLND